MNYHPSNEPTGRQTLKTGITQSDRNANSMTTSFDAIRHQTAAHPMLQESILKGCAQVLSHCLVAPFWHLERAGNVHAATAVTDDAAQT
jgi:hypothetical protein